MFTGLVEHLAQISSITPATDGADFTFTLSQCGPILADCTVGDSIAVNGACLTVTSFDAAEGWFTVGLANETLRRTNLGELQVGGWVNCERAMSGHTRFGGHLVQGHVDTTAKIVSKIPDGQSIRFTFLPNPPPEPIETSPSATSATSTPSSASLLPYLIPKGYVTVDGASLTLTHVGDAHSLTFSIMLITHSQEKLTLAKKEVGEEVNIELDAFGKYVVRSLEVAGEGSGLKGMVEAIVDRKLAAAGLIKTESERSLMAYQ